VYYTDIQNGHDLEVKVDVFLAKVQYK